MSSLSSLYITRAKLAELLHVVDVKQEKGVELTISISDETNEYGQNVSSYVSQSKEQREAKKQRFYTGNGKVFWTDGNIKVAVKPEPKQSAPMDVDEIGTSDRDMPF